MTLTQQSSGSAIHSRAEAWPVSSHSAPWGAPSRSLDAPGRVGRAESLFSRGHGLPQGHQPAHAEQGVDLACSAMGIPEVSGPGAKYAARDRSRAAGQRVAGRESVRLLGSENIPGGEPRRESHALPGPRKDCAGSRAGFRGNHASPAQGGRCTSPCSRRCEEERGPQGSACPSPLCWGPLPSSGRMLPEAANPVKLRSGLRWAAGGCGSR